MEIDADSPRPPGIAAAAAPKRKLVGKSTPSTVANFPDSKKSKGEKKGGLPLPLEDPNKGLWNNEERALFLEDLNKREKKWRKISSDVKTKSSNTNETNIYSEKEGNTTCKCTKEGCNIQTKSGGKCAKHISCTTEGCDNQTFVGGKCRKHGDRTKCSQEGCDSLAVKGGKCRKHGDRTKCSQEGCDSLAVKGGKCRRHGDRTKCSQEGCDNQTYVGGKCRKHHHRARISQKDSREIVRMVTGTDAKANDYITNKHIIHGSITPPEDMELTDNVLMIKPGNQLDHYPTIHRDLYFTKYLLHAARFVMGKKQIKAGGSFFLYKLVDIDDSDHCGLGSGGHFRSIGQEGMYKTPKPAKVKSVIHVKLGSKGNMSDADSTIMLIRDECDMDKVLSIDLKQNERGIFALNAPSDHYHDGSFNLDDDDSVDVSMMQELTFVDGVPPLEENQDNGVDQRLVNEIETSLFETQVDEVSGLGMTAKLSLTTMSFSPESGPEANEVFTLTKAWHARTLTRVFKRIMQQFKAVSVSLDKPYTKLSIEMENHDKLRRFFKNKMNFDYEFGKSQDNLIFMAKHL